MPTNGMKTYSAKPSEVVSSWHVMDAAGKPLGRLASEIATILQGKNKPMYTRHILTGDFVVVINAAQVGITGQKSERKKYYRYSGYHGGLKVTNFRLLLARHPDQVIQHAVKGMLPRNALSSHMLKRLKIYPGPDHPHQAQIAAQKTHDASPPAGKAASSEE